MKIHRSINKHVQRIFNKIKHRYLKGTQNGKPTSFYYHISFYHLYLKRLGWLIVSLLTFKSSTYENFQKVITGTYFSNEGYQIYSVNGLKALFRDLFGYNFLERDDLYPIYKASVIRKTKNISFRTFSYPLVSIIIPVYNKLSYTYNCLLSIQDHVSSLIDYEIIIIDDCSDDGTEEFFRNRTQGLKYIRNTENLGYLISNNKAIDYAEGKYICLLNNDTEVQIDWLESMLEVIENDEQVGCVGSKLIYPNKMLQEAGGIIFSDANGANFGRMDDPDRLVYNFIREVDYCSAASILFRKSDFEKIGKFDTQFAPAYYEDTDLCFTFRNILHKKIIYQPLSKVIHHEGISSGKEIKEGSVKNFQSINRLKFLKKWKTFLTEHDTENSGKSYRRLLPSRSIMVLEWHLPAFDKDSGSLRLFRILNLLKSLNLHVIYIPESGEISEPYYSAMIKAGIEIRIDLNSENSVDDFMTVEYIDSVKYIWISRPDLNELYMDKISRFKNIKWIYDTVDLHHIRMLREVEITNNQTHIASANKMKELEISLAKKADLSITVTEVEKQILETYQAKHVFTVPNVHIPVAIKDFKSFSERSGLVFIGGYAHAPNVDAAMWLIQEIMPIVWEKEPKLSLYLLGSNPPDTLLQSAGERVFVPGYIEDVSSYFQNSRVFIAPLRYGAGMKGKIGQALEYCLPIISTSIGGEGMGLVNEKQILIANKTEHFANQILRLYNDQNLWEQLSGESESAILSYSPQVVKESLRNMFNKLEYQVCL